MQRLMTIYLSNYAGFGSIMQSGEIQEYLSKELANGWRIAQIVPVAGSGSEGTSSCAWVVVVLEED